jgi:hypothetical protein
MAPGIETTGSQLREIQALRAPRLARRAEECDVALLVTRQWFFIPAIIAFLLSRIC